MPMTSGISASGSAIRLSPRGGGRFDAIIFDMGTTLIEFENIPWPVLYRICVDATHRRLTRLGYTPPPLEAYWERFNRLLDRRRRRIRDAMREYRIGDLLRESVQVAGVRLKSGDLSRLCNAYYAPIRRALTVYDDARPVLAALQERGFTIGLLSNTCFRVRDHREDLRRFGLWPYFHATLFTSTIPYRKPHREPFLLICGRLGVDPARCLYIGDRQKEDVLGPQGVGMAAVLIRRPLRAYQPGLTDAVEITSLNDLPALIET